MRWTEDEGGTEKRKQRRTDKENLGETNKQREKRDVKRGGKWC